jgi:DNA-binding transcriptional LysR family regulator
MNIELRQLRYFVAVAEELHFGRAALLLNMSQPPLSQAIQQLESLLGTKLFIRNTRKITLSAAGLALLPEAKKLIEQAKLLPQLVQRAACGEIGQLSISFISIADFSVLPPALSQFRRNHQEVKISLQEATSDIQLAMLENNEIDIGFIIPPIPSSLDKIINYHKILEEPLLLAIHESQVRKVNADMLISYKELPLILFPRQVSPTLHDTILACFRKENITPVIAQEAIQMQTIIALVSADIGMALVPQSVANLKIPGVIYQPLQNINSYVEIGIAWRKDNPSAVIQAFLRLFQPH